MVVQKVEKSDGKVEVQFGPEILNEYKFPEVDWHNCDQITVDLLEVTYMVSVGLKNWINWVEEIIEKNPGIKFVFKNTHYYFLQLHDSVSGGLNLDAKLHSIHISYFCENCQKNLAVLYDCEDLKKQMAAGKNILEVIESSACNTCQSTVEMDAIPQSVVKLLEEYGVRL